MSKNPFAERAARKAATLPEQQGALPQVPSTFSNGTGAQATVTIAQGRAEKMLTFSDLPDPVETPDATGDLSQEEEEIFALCMQGVQQFENAWWVMGKAMSNINARRLYRKTHANFEDFAQDVFKKSRPIAYEEMTSYAIGELLSARADTPVIGKKAAGALNPITKDYGPEASVAIHETIKDATGKDATVKQLKGVITQLPRKKDKELTQEELLALARELATAKAQEDDSSSDEQGQNDAPPALYALRSVVNQLAAAHRGLAPAKLRAAQEEDPAATAELLEEAQHLAAKIVNRVGAS